MDELAVAVVNEVVQIEIDSAARRGGACGDNHRIGSRKRSALRAARAATDDRQASRNPGAERRTDPLGLVLVTVVPGQVRQDHRSGQVHARPPFLGVVAHDRDASRS